MTDSIQLSATSALVLLWACPDLYRSEAARLYWSRLDLAPGLELHRLCHAVWSEYDQVIKNRKWQIAAWADAALANGIDQAVIVAAGVAPLGIELAANHPSCRVFEVDMMNMPEKRSLARNLPGLENRIAFLAGDVSQTQEVADLLARAGWAPTEPSLLICEGISYYLTKGASEGLWDLARAPGSRVIFEYLLPEDQIAEAFRHIPHGVFQAIWDYCQITAPLTTWTRQEVNSRSPMQVLMHRTLHDIEALRPNSIPVFPTADSGWIELLLMAPS